MSQIKNFAENVSVALGKEGEIDDDVCKVADMLLSLISKWGLKVDFGITNFTDTVITEGDAMFRQKFVNEILISGTLNKQFGP